MLGCKAVPKLSLLGSLRATCARKLAHFLRLIAFAHKLAREKGGLVASAAACRQRGAARAFFERETHRSACGRRVLDRCETGGSLEFCNVSVRCQGLIWLLLVCDVS